MKTVGVSPLHVYMKLSLLYTLVSNYCNVLCIIFMVVGIINIYFSSVKTVGVSPLHLYMRLRLIYTLVSNNCNVL